MSSSEPFQFELEPGERMLWSGAPRTGLALTSSDAMQIPIGLTILYVLANTFRHASFGGPIDVMLAWVIAAAALYVAVGRFFFEAYRRGKSAYALTSERMLVRDFAFSNFVKAFPLNTITDTRLDELRNGYGNIWIMRRYLPEGWQDARMSRTRGRPLGFQMIPDAAHVFELLEAARLTRPAPTLASLFENRQK